MPNYKCERCMKEFRQKCHYTYHINKKFKCKNVALDCPKNAPNCPKIGESIGKPEYICNYCKKEFTRKYHLIRHIDKNCNVKKENDNRMEEIMTTLIELKESNKKNKEEIEKLKEENTNYKKIIHNIQNTKETPKINAYGSENMNNITKMNYKYFFSRGINSVPVFIKNVHFNKNTPENHNIYISNLRDAYVLIYDGTQWKIDNKEDVLQQLYEYKSDILETKFEELKEQLDESIIKMFQRLIKIKNDDDDNNKKIKVIKNEIKKVLYNNREMVLKPKKN